MPWKNRNGSAAEKAAIAESELSALFDDFANSSKTLLAVSGGPDSTALLVLAAKWRAKRGSGPELVAATIDHRLRAASKNEAKMVAKLAAKLGIPHHTLVWSGKKPITGVQEAAREARFELFSDLAKEIGADLLMTAHTRDDQAETVLHRMGRGSGLGGLAGIRRVHKRGGIFLGRPFLELPKARLVATLKKLRIPFASDPTNRDTKYLRARLRKLAPVLAKEGIDAANLALMAKRLARANAALNRLADEAAFALRADADAGRAFEVRGFFLMPEELSIRMLREAIDAEGIEGPAELAKVETLYDALVHAYRAGEGTKRTLAGALVTLSEAALIVAAAPPRKSASGKAKKARKP
ncbi:MAG: tRNA lysidine(34) synthetase TilS [Xanthobacteraceae bacterium]|nr:tRNA lysidine(34) synthetase TilS [Xanthobacteraceae bacterium]MCW5676820.1 tRNA lysidine(34) synthetase TilS [Xanthobacteraceae bacterium]